jgi:hypothetical protein
MMAVKVQKWLLIILFLREISSKSWLDNRGLKMQEVTVVQVAVEEAL